MSNMAVRQEYETMFQFEHMMNEMSAKGQILADKAKQLISSFKRERKLNIRQLTKAEDDNWIIRGTTRYRKIVIPEILSTHEVESYLCNTVSDDTWGTVDVKVFCVEEKTIIYRFQAMKIK